MPRERVHHGKLTATWREDSFQGIAGAIVSKDYTHDSYNDPSIPATATVASEPSLDVSWNRTGWVQVSIEMSPEKVAALAKAAKDRETTTATIYTEILTRDEINNMIKTLRKARDQAYGIDE